MTRIMKSIVLAAVASVATGAFAQASPDVLYTGPVKNVRPTKAIELISMKKENGQIKIFIDNFF